MATKEKNQSTVTAPAASTDIGPPPPGLRVNADVDARLTKFMADNPEITEHYTKLVKEHPGWAIRSLALRTMFRHEDIARQNERQMPHVEEWVGQQPGLKERLDQRIRTKNPIFRAAAFISEAFKAKGRIELAPVESNRTGRGISI